MFKIIIRLSTRTDGTLNRFRNFIQITLLSSPVSIEHYCISDNWCRYNTVIHRVIIDLSNRIVNVMCDPRTATVKILKPLLKLRSGTFSRYYIIQPSTLAIYSHSCHHRFKTPNAIIIRTLTQIHVCIYVLYCYRCRVAVIYFIVCIYRMHTRATEGYFYIRARPTRSF